MANPILNVEEMPREQLEEVVLEQQALIKFLRVQKLDLTTKLTKAELENEQLGEQLFKVRCIVKQLNQEI